MASFISMDTFTTIQLSMASVSIMAGVATLWVLNDMNKWTGFLLLVATLSVAQMIYDVGFFFRANTQDPLCRFLWYVFQVWGGMATTLLTNVIAFIVANIAMTLRSYDIKKNYAFIMSWVTFISMAPALVLAITSVMQPAEEYGSVITVTAYVYAVLRILSISINFGAYLVLTLRLRRMGLSLSTNKNAPLHPVAALSSRMIYYPIVQLLTRLAAAWMEFKYPSGGAAGDDDAMTQTTDYQIANVLYSVSSPSAGIGFFLIFLFMQPAAWSHLKARICCNKIEYTTGHSLKADILRESHSVCINEIDGSSDEGTSQTSNEVFDGHSPLANGMGLHSNERGFSADRGMFPGFRPDGRTRSQGSHIAHSNRQHQGNARILSSEENSPVYRDHLLASEDGRDSVHSNTYFFNNTNTKSMSQSHASTTSNSYLPDKLALLDDDELAGLVDKLANLSQHAADDVQSATEASISRNSFNGRASHNTMNTNA